MKALINNKGEWAMCYKGDGTIEERLEKMLMAGHYPFVICNRLVSMPVEAEDYFTEDEMDEVRELILRNVRASV